MQTLSFTLRLYKGQEQNLITKHRDVWPELIKLFKETGIKDYRIFFDKKTNTIFETMKIDNETSFDMLCKSECMLMWYLTLGRLVDTDKNHIPIRVPLTEIFYMP